MASIFKRGAKYCLEYTDARGVRRRKTGFTDKRRTQLLAAQYEKEAADERAGLPVAARRQAEQPVADLIAAYCADLERLGRTRHYVYHCRLCLQAAAAGCGWHKAGDVTAASLGQWLAAAHAQSTPRTANSYRDAAARFCRWAAQMGHFSDPGVSRVRRARVTAPVRPRRAFTPDEFARLVAGVEKAHPERALAYRLAAYSGLRRGELKKVCRQDVLAAADRWRWTLRAEITKSRRAENLPMIPECQRLLRENGVEALEPKARLVPRVPGARTLARDMARAGVERHDARGRVADWHSLRRLFCRQLAARLPIQVVQKLMRHKSIKHTVDIYMDLDLDDVTEALNAIPEVFGP